MGKWFFMNDKQYSGGFQDLNVWKEARLFKSEISKLCKNIPKDENFRLIDQLKRASRSITANIAEGYGRYHFQENIQFCRQARGSLMECLDHLICASDELYITKDQLDLFEKDYYKILKLLNGYISFLQEKKSNPQ